MQVFNWVISHWVDIVQIYLQIIGVASIVVKLTPSLKDDNVLSKIIDFVGNFIALNKPKNV